jgi:predicted ATPase with chaperone activity
MSLVQTSARTLVSPRVNFVWSSYTLRDAVKAFPCAPSTVTRYQKPISGPLLDRIDIYVEVLQVGYQKLSSDCLGESSKAIRLRVEGARQIQRERFSNIKSSNVIGQPIYTPALQPQLKLWK